jgi:DNA polymerase-1
MPKLLLLDGNSLLYRGFFAMRSLSTASGQPVNAIYSVALMLLTLGREESDAVVCAWDTPEPTFRHIEFPAYKAQRAAPPEDLVAQRDLARDLMSVFNIVSVEAPGWEADDLIGAIAEREKRQGVEVTIVTGDMDSAQLVDDSHGPVRVMSTVKGVTQTVLYNEAAVRERYGLTPRQIPDFKALKGDPSDNIPGVPGIGDKTATSLLSQFGSIENLIEKVDEVKPVRIQSLIRENSELAIMCKRIATICRDFDLPKDFEIHYDYSGPDAAAAKELFEKLS